MQTTDLKPALIDMKGKHSDISNLIREGDPCCAREEGIWFTKFREGKEMDYKSVNKKRVFVNVRTTERDFELSFNLESDRVPVKWHDFKEVNETNCIIDEKEAYSRERDADFWASFILLPGRYGQRFVNSEGDLLQGTKKVDNPDESTTTFTWNLACCRN